jgi:hypothetical protein
MGTYWMEDLTGFVKNEGFIHKGLTLLSKKWGAARLAHESTFAGPV